MMHIPWPPRPLAAPLLAPLLTAAIALAARLAGDRLGRPVLSFAAAGIGLVAGWAWLQGLALALTPPSLPTYAAAALLAAGLAAQPQATGRKRPRPARTTLDHALAVLIAIFGAWWLAGAGMPPPMKLLAGLVAIGGAMVLGTDAYALAAGAVTLTAALFAIGAPAAMTSLAAVTAAATLGAGPLLPLAAGLGGAMAAAMDHTTLRPHHVPPMALAAATPLLTLLLIAWWRHRFTRFGRAAPPLRALCAASLASLLTFSAAALQGLR